MNLVYGADVKIKIVLKDNRKDIDIKKVMTKEEIDKALKEINAK